mgnify:CR=1 FL=1
MKISFEKAQGWPARTRRSSPDRSNTVGSFLATLIVLRLFAFGDAIAPRVRGAFPALRRAADGGESTFVRADLYFMAQRAQSQVVEVDASHAVAVSHPDDVAAIILDAAHSIH